MTSGDNSLAILVWHSGKEGFSHKDCPSFNSSSKAPISVSRPATSLPPFSEELVDPSEIEVYQRKFYQSLSEKDKRRYAAIESLQLGRGGITTSIHIFGIDPKTIRAGIQEFKNLPDSVFFSHRIRQPGGGRKAYDVKNPQINQQFLEILKNHTAGDPMDEKAHWTHLYPSQIAPLLQEDYGVKVSPTAIRKLFEKHDYHRRKAQKKETFKSVAYRDEQFKNIACLNAQYLADGNPSLSMDTKKKERIGNFYRDGVLYVLSELRTFDHDFLSYGDGVVIPHGLWDQRLNLGYLTLGTSKDTSEFACDSIRNWWYKKGQYQYPQATSILIKCDGGGSNASNSYLFKEDLQKLVNRLGRQRH